MCGIAGWYNCSFSPEVLKNMLDSLKHRGPDERGVYYTENSAVGHVRLSVLDLEGGQQPVQCLGGEVLAFNGEIYNFRQLNKELADLGFPGDAGGDTAVLARAWSCWGVRCLSKLDGMFAISVYDPKNRVMILARDTYGEKPLYYIRRGNGFFFASEIKAMKGVPDWNPSLNPNGVRSFFTTRYAAGANIPQSGVERLQPGRFLVADVSGLRIEKFGNIADGFLFPENMEDFEPFFVEAIASRIVSDVPLGIYLSGGIDSGLIASIASRKSRKRLKAFTVALNEDDDDFIGALRTAKELDLDHTPIFLNADDYLRLPEIVGHMDLPNTDSIIVAQYRLAETASKTVKVVLTGDGADEIDYGYHHIHQLYHLNQLFKYLPTNVRSKGLWLINNVPIAFMDRISPYQFSIGERGLDRIKKMLGKSPIRLGM